jgi:hypothetical protein
MRSGSRHGPQQPILRSLLQGNLLLKYLLPGRHQRTRTATPQHTKATQETQNEYDNQPPTTTVERTNSCITTPSSRRPRSHAHSQTSHISDHDLRQDHPSGSTRPPPSLRRISSRSALRGTAPRQPHMHPDPSAYPRGMLQPTAATMENTTDTRAPTSRPSWRTLNITSRSPDRSRLAPTKT